MRKIPAILFICIYLFSTTELYQFLKIPALVEHLVEHRKTNSDITFLQFLYQHYSTKNDNTENHDARKSLPFQSHENCASLSSVTFVPLVAAICIPQPKHAIVIRKYVIEDNFQLPSFFANIWQPPRFSAAV